MIYDYIIVGAGPCGLVLSHLLSKFNFKSIIIDKNNSIGGCHRVFRTNNLFSEHSPRVYSSSFINFINILDDMNIKFDNIFRKYKTINKITSGLTIRESLIIIKHYSKLFFDDEYGFDISTKSFLIDNNFNDKSKDYIDRICRLTDGADSSRYTLNQFLQLLNQNLLYSLYQPRKPNDKLLLKQIYDSLMRTNNIDFMLNSEVIKLNYDTSNNLINNVITSRGIVEGKNVILAIPPRSLLKILDNSYITDIFMDNFKDWTIKTSYNDDISMTFHWNNKLDINNIWGFPQNDYGIAFINLTNYMDFEDERSKTVISLTITITDKKSKNNKTADEIDNENELKDEVFRQLREIFGELPRPKYMILSPNIYRKDNRWINGDSAYIRTPNTVYLSHYCKIKNLYNVGTHNGKSKYSFTTIESSIVNTISFINEIIPESKNKYKIRDIYTIKDIIRYMIIIVIIVIMMILYKKYKK